MFTGVQWTGNKSTQVSELWETDRDEHVYVGNHGNDAILTFYPY